MKKHIALALAGTLALSLASCDPKKTGGREGNNPETEGVEGVETDEPEPVAEYYEEAYDVIDSEVIDPNDEEAYRMYGVQEEEEEVAPGRGTPSDVDILDLPITETSQIDLLLDDFQAINNSLRTLYRNPSANATPIQNSLNRAVRITEKINEGSTHMTQTQLDRYSRLTDEFLEVIGQ